MIEYYPSIKETNEEQSNKVIKEANNGIKEQQHTNCGMQISTELLSSIHHRHISIQ
jgi:hypothetical protein